MNDNRVFLEKKAWLLLLLDAGMPYDMIEKVLGISPSSARNYVARVQKTSEWEGKVPIMYDARPIMLKLYADIKHGDKRIMYDAGFKTRLMAMLAEVLEEEKIVEILNFSLPAINSFSILQYADDVPLGYRNLLEELRLYSQFHSFGWPGYLLQLTSGKKPIPHPKEFIWGKNHYLHTILQSSVDETRRYVAPTLTSRICQYVDTILDELTQKEKQVIEMFFGLKRDPQTEEKIGEEFDLTRGRVGQIKEKAIRRIKRRFLHLNPISNAWETIESLNAIHHEAMQVQQHEYIQKLQELEHPEELTPTEPPVISEFTTLIKKVTAVELSVRVLNCIRTADERIDYVWQLVMLPKTQLLKLRNFGKKSLTELEEYVKYNNLRFGREFTKAEVALLESATTNKVGCNLM